MTPSRVMNSCTAIVPMIFSSIRPGVVPGHWSASGAAHPLHESETGGPTSGAEFRRAGPRPAPASGPASRWLGPPPTPHLAGGRRLELEALHGTVVRLGREHGVEVPASQALSATLKPWESGDDLP